MRNYVRRAKTFEPLIDDELQRDIVAEYVNLRDEDPRSADGSWACRRGRDLFIVGQ